MDTEEAEPEGAPPALRPDRDRCKRRSADMALPLLGVAARKRSSEVLLTAPVSVLCRDVGICLALSALMLRGLLWSIEIEGRKLAAALETGKKPGKWIAGLAAWARTDMAIMVSVWYLADWTRGGKASA